MQTLNGHFDGKVVVLDEPANLKPNTRVKVIALAVDESDRASASVNDFARVSEESFRKIWDNPLDADYDRL